MNAILENILFRRSVREFKPEQIKKEELDAILLAAQYAPSGSNSQSWIFTVLQNKELLLELNESVSESIKTLDIDDNYPAKINAKKRAENGIFMMYYDAPTLVIVSNLKDYTNNKADCACAIENMFLAATSLGIGSCWINQVSWVYDKEPTRKVLSKLNIPDSHMIGGCVALGYPVHFDLKAAPRREGTIWYFV